MLLSDTKVKIFYFYLLLKEKQYVASIESLSDSTFNSQNDSDVEVRESVTHKRQYQDTEIEKENHEPKILCQWSTKKQYKNLMSALTTTSLIKFFHVNFIYYIITIFNITYILRKLKTTIYIYVYKTSYSIFFSQRLFVLKS